jgi:small GTP-binding protein
MTQDRSAKTVIIGDSSVGKTSIVSRFVNGTFDAEVHPTLGVEFITRTLKTPSGPLELQLWDTAGEELFRSVTRGYYRGAIAAFLVFDLTKRKTFESLPGWISDVRSVALPGVVLILLGNKCDLISNREIVPSEVLEFVNKEKLVYFETSAKTGESIEAAIMRCIDEIENLIDSGTRIVQSAPTNSVLSAVPDNVSNEGKCCYL